MEEHDLRWDSVFGTLDERSSAVEEGRRESKFGLLRLLVDLRADEDETVRIPQAGYHRRPAAADNDLVALVVHYLEVVREFQTGLVFGESKV